MTHPRAHHEPSARLVRPRAAFGLSALLLGALAAAPLPARAEEYTVATTRVDDAKEVLATVESIRAPQARARIGGTVESLAVAEGDRVKKGAVLANVVDPKHRLQLAAFDNRIAALEAKLAQIQTDLERVRQLRATGAAPQSRLDEAETQLSVTRSEIAATQADKASVESMVLEGRVVAPDDGRILKIQAIAGQVVMPGEPVATLATSAYVLKLRLPERHARFMHEGDRVMVAGRGLDVGAREQLREGRITHVYPELDFGRVVADAQAEGLGDYFVGERIRVLVSTGTRDVVMVPDAYVIRRAGLTFANLAGRGEVPVQIGRRLPDMSGQPARIEILSGLVAGDKVVKP